MERFVVLLALALVGTVAESQPQAEQAVVIEDALIESAEPPTAIRQLRPSMIVNVLDRRGNAVLVQREFGLTAKGWIPAAAIADASAFRPLRQWRGRTRHQVYSDSGDSSRTYSLRPDASFRSRDSTSAGDARQTGQLHQYRSVVWARPDRLPTPRLDPWAFFRVEKDGSLCTFSDEGDCQR